MSANPFVPEDFDPPTRLETDRFVLVPLGVEHNERDHDAWMSSIDHIHATPGFQDGPWPHEMSLQDWRTVIDPVLRDNGGPTLTHALLAGGAAVDAGSNAEAVGPDGFRYMVGRRRRS